MNAWPVRSLAIAACSLALALASASPARAADPAATAFDDGTRSFRLGRYAEAAAAYERAATLNPHPLALVNAAESWERAGHPVQAANACDRALALTTSGDLRTKIEQRLERVLARIGTLEISGDDGFEVRVDGGEPLRPPARLRVSPGRHRVVMSTIGAAAGAEREVLVSAGATHHLVLSASRIEVSEPVRREPKPEVVVERAGGGPPLGSWIAFGIAGAAGVSAGILGVMTLGAKDDFDARPTVETADEFERYRLFTNVAIGTAVLATAVGVVFWITKPSQTPPGVAMRF